jgi:hypothetical protein
MDLSGIWVEAGRLLNDPNNDRWTQAVLTTRANEAQTIVQALTKAVKIKESLTPTADTQEVTINTSTIDILRVVLTLPNGDKKIIEGIPREELDYRMPGWENLDSGEPDMYFFDASNAQINLVRKPSSTYAIASSLEVWEARKPADMDDSADIPFDSNVPMTPYHLSVVHWVVAQCWMDDGTPESLAKAKFHKSGILERPGEFEKQIILIRADFDNPTDIPANILWRPQGGRLGRTNRLSKTNPLGFN